MSAGHATAFRRSSQAKFLRLLPDRGGPKAAARASAAYQITIDGPFSPNESVSNAA
jgi:hypothetical protein